MIKIIGESKLGENRYILKRKKVNKSFTGLKQLYLDLKERSVLGYPVNNFARFDGISKASLIAIALALYDANIKYNKDQKQSIGILLSSVKGALDAQIDYFKDYVESGRTLGRGNLFIYTLPTSPLAEAAIHFGFSGPLIYVGIYQDLREPELIDYAKSFINYNQAKTMAVLLIDSDWVSCRIIR